MPLTICHVLWSVEVGGAERVVLDLVRAQRRRGHRLLVVTLSNVDGAMAADFREAADDLAAVRKRGGTDPTLPFRLARWFRKHHVDVVHTHNELPLIYAAPGGRVARRPVVHSKHGVVPVNARAHFLRKAAARAVSAFVAVSKATAIAARENGEAPEGKLRTIVNGTDLSRFPAEPGARAAIRRELGIPEDARVVATVGRVVKEKNHALLVRAAAPLLGEKRRLVIVGDGALRGEVESLARSMPNGDRMHFAGKRRDVPQVLAAADAFVLSSDTEGLPIGLLEAWAARLPIASTAVGGVPDVVDRDVDGLLVPPGDPAALTAALARLFEGGDDIRAMAERGAAKVRATFSADAMAAAYLSLYDEVA